MRKLPLQGHLWGVPTPIPLPTCAPGQKTALGQGWKSSSGSCAGREGTKPSGKGTGVRSVAENKVEKLLWGSVTHLHHQNLKPCTKTLLLLWFGGLWGWAGVTLPARNPAKTSEEAHEEGGRAV